MLDNKKKAYRLFKVAKELNVGSSTLVDHLQTQGFEVDNNPNQKLTSEMYDLLLKEFASEKHLKEKAEALREQKREQQAPAEEQMPEEEDILSAEQLRSGLLKQQKAAEKKAEATPPVTTSPPVVKEEKPQVIKPEPEVVTPPPVEEKKEPVVAEKESPQEEDESGSGLKVLGKIDLSRFSKTGKRKKSEPTTPKPEAEKAKPADTKPAPEKEEKKEVKVAAEKEAPQPVEEKKALQKKPKEAEPVKEKPAEEVKAPVKEEAEKPAEAEVEEKKETKKDEVIRASDRAPKLAGLTVKGKIELPSDRKSKSSSSSTESEEDKKRKRKRKRKRKKTTAVSPPAGGNKDAGKKRTTKKEELTEKQIQEQIRQTLAEIDRRSGRNRQRLRRQKRDEDAQKREAEAMERAEAEMVLDLTEFITANEFANMIKVPVTEIITKCLELDLFISINTRLEADNIAMLAEEYGYKVNFIDAVELIIDDDEEEVDESKLVPRAPIVTVMGHVDHGKTSLLDHIRDENVIAGEAGGITQHVGAYEVTLKNGREITFLDTPGHEAFTAMRARGAKVTDVVIIVIAADDAVMPQTKEAINHAEAAGVPMVFALNKIDKPGANTDRIREQLAGMNYLVEDWGGKYQCQEISAKKGVGIDDLLEKVLLEAELLELKGNPEKNAVGSVIEARLDKGRGVVATMIVQDGTLRVGDSFVAGVHLGKIKALMNERGQRIKEASVSQPVQILGLTGVPTAGDVFKVYPTEQKAKEIANKRSELKRQHDRRQVNILTLDEIGRRRLVGDFQELNLIVKGDVDGSVEALSDSLQKLSTEEVQVKIVLKGVGQISESDVNLATASDAVIIGFQVRPSASARKLAEKEGVDIRLYSIIYDTINDVRDALEGLLSPEIKEEILGSAEIREVFKISKVGAVAGCMVLEGKIARNLPVRLIRDGIVIYPQGKLSSLKRFKDDVREVDRGFECGMQIDGYNDIKEGDVIESFREVEEKRTL